MKKILLLLVLLSACAQPFPEQNIYPDAYNADGVYGAKTWTILVYMNGDNSLSSYTIPDLLEMQKVNLGSNINVIVLWDRSGLNDTQLLKIKYDPSHGSSVISERLSATINGSVLSSASTQEVDMLSSQSLIDFINFGKTSYPADYYAVIFWGHGDGWKSDVIKGFDQDNNPSGSIMTNEQMAIALQGKGISVVGFDACLQGTMETLWAFQKYNSADYLVASPDNVPGNGWNYALFLSYFSENSYRRPYDFGYQAIEAYKKNYSKVSTTSLGLYDVQYLRSNFSVLTDFFFWANSQKTTEKLILNNSLSTLDYGGFADLKIYSGMSAYHSKAMVLSFLDKMILHGWKYELGNAKVIGISSNTYGSEVIPLCESYWGEFLKP